ncbi:MULTISPECIES: terminase large subunit [Prauserella salsuginis group]|uniref:Terminase large subunit n=1 Tax=Prauserella salsuginis TaxID=387889 RepID=A0ABW6G5R9_9PSEU|nr:MULTISPECIES: terminase TerL endonuclease subunit [Prauserella salsuginis group]MCR3719147.1 Phage terminase-like protein, large subunit, contains N-terminal HTH domain [Prauserella flava]MCR3735840.1 Phage terminase-like protein, large subunit, contains N-terminal HTH domain [Prauserella salsuginis]
MTATSSTELPVPRDALLELGLTDEQIDEAVESTPLVVACQAQRQPGAWFDVERVRRALKALGQFRHTKGRWSGRPFRIGQGLAPWQVVWVIAPVFGWVVWDEEIGEVVRVARTVWVEVPRKNGKSTISSGIANVLLLADGEAGAEVYAAAGSLDQAGRVFEDAKRMCLTSKAARSRVQALASVIRVPKTGGVLRALSKIAETAHGLNVSGGVIDEVHVHKSRHLIDAIETGTGARSQPLIVFITTADEATEGSIYDEKHSYTRKIADNVVEDPSHYGVIWAADEGDDPFAEETWRKANPGLGTSPTLSYIRKEARKAETTPSYFPTFCRLHLNRRMRDQARLIDMGLWDGSAGMTDLSRVQGRRAWGGLDLSAVSDFTAWWMGVETWQPHIELEFFWRFYVPEDRVDELERQLQVPLKQWIRNGFVRATEGNVIDYTAVQADVLADCKKVDMQRISYDRMFAGQMVQELDTQLRGVDVVPVAQTFLGMSPAIKELQRLIGEDALRHGGNPVARWMASVVETKDDGNDNLKLVKPERQKSQARIDGMSALVTGLDGYVRRPVKKKTKVVAL